MTTPLARHLVSVWNPSYAEDAMDAHLRVLLHWAEAAAAGSASLEDAYVWWAKLRSPNRQQPLPHAAEILALQAQIDEGVETHLYLTDYRSLYVGHIEEIVAGDLLDHYPDDEDHLPGYYSGLHADFWFLLGDIRRIVADDTLATIEELQKLRNVRYHDRPVSLYGGMVELPLIVTREDQISWFRDANWLIDGRLWAEHDAEMRSLTEQTGRDVRDNLLGRTIWSGMEPGTRAFISAAEAVFRSRREDPGFDFSGPAVAYVKAVELELNALLFPALRSVLARRPPHEREAVIDGRLLDLGLPVPHQSLGTIRGLLEHEPKVSLGLRAGLPQDAIWILGELPYRLSALGDLRNPAAHSESVRREAASDVREEILGIGQEGLLVRIARAKMRRAR